MGKESLKLSYIVENSQDAIIGITLDGIITSWNKGAEKNYGYTMEEVLGKNIRMTIPDDKQYEINSVLKKLNEGSEIDYYETIRKKKNNVPINVSVMVSPIYDFKGTMIGASIIARDITKQKENTKYIEMLSNVLETSVSIIVIADSKGNIEYVNKKFEEVTGYDKEETIGKNIEILNLKTQNDEFYKKIKETINSGQEWDGEICDKRKDGSIFWCITHIASLKDEQGEIIRFIAMSEDITEKKYFSEEITKKNSELENALISLDELQMKLIQEDKMASIGQLSAGIAHEINNPLGFVTSNFNTLKKYTEKFNEYVIEHKNLRTLLRGPEIEAISGEIDRIDSLEKKYKIEYILKDFEELYKDTNEGLERIKKIVVTLKNFMHHSDNNCFEDYNINEGIKDTLVIARNELKYNIEIKTNLIETIKLIKADASEINQVLLNVIINASQAIKEKYNDKIDFYGEIKITTWNDSEFVYCSIKDNGSGVSKKNIIKIFNPFFTTKPVGKGTGLGLSISHDIIVDKYKGDIKVESILGEGTTFSIILPIYRREQL